jgi:hypothetical protein
MNPPSAMARFVRRVTITLLTALLGLAGTAFAADYPTKPVQ